MKGSPFPRVAFEASLLTGAGAGRLASSWRVGLQLLPAPAEEVQTGRVGLGQDRTGT